MKKQLYLLTAGLLLVCLANAQIKKGDILLGGNVNFNSSTTDPTTNDYTNKTIGYGFSPSIGKAVHDDLVVGLNLIFTHNKTKSGATPVGVGVQDTYGLGVFVRKYKVLGAGFALFGEGDLGGLYQTTNNYSEGSPKPPANKYYSINAGFYPGIAYFISRHVQLETGMRNLAYIQYGHSRSGSGTVTSSTKNFSAGTGFSQAFDNFVVGVTWIL